MDKGYVLHSYPYRETSLILQVWTQKHGRLGLVAKGARRPKSATRSVLIPFQPLALDWLSRACATRDPEVGFLKVDPRWDAVRSDPRFANLLAGLGLAE